MAPRKSSSKKAKSQSPPEEIIIEGVAEAVDPAEDVMIKTKSKSARRAKAETVGEKPKLPSFAMIISLAALLAGIIGAGLGGLAYINIMPESDETSQNEVIAAMVEEKIASSLTPILDDIAILKTDLDKTAKSDQDIQDLTARIVALEAELAQLQSGLHDHDADLSADRNHQHDDNIDRASFMAALSQINAEIEALKNAPPPVIEPEAEEKSEISNDDNTNQGWWKNLMGAFSITRIDTKTEEVE